MKKLILSSIIFAGIIAFAGNASAQFFAFGNSSRSVKLNPHPDASSKIVRESEVSINAVRDFKRSYDNATNIKWQLHENGSSVYFTYEDVKMRSTYNASGKKLYTLKYLTGETGLPAGMRDYVRSNYYNYNIALVTEVLTGRQNYYLVQMENPDEILTLKIIDDEITVSEKIQKRK